MQVRILQVILFYAPGGFRFNLFLSGVIFFMAAKPVADFLLAAVNRKVDKQGDQGLASQISRAISKEARRAKKWSSC